MIQLATDPTASRMSYRLARSEDEAKDSGFDTKRGRTGHAWPFLSRYAPRPVRQDGQKTTGSGSNS
jgi:hypothetical protein